MIMRTGTPGSWRGLNLHALGLGLILLHPAVSKAQQEEPPPREAPASEPVQPPAQDGLKPAEEADPLSSAPVDDGEFSLELDERMDVGVAWPDMDAAMPALEPAAPEGEAPLEEQAVEAPPPPGDGEETGALAETEADAPAGSETLPDDGAERRYQVILRGMEEIESGRIEGSFDSLSTLKEEDGDPANLAQINRRIQLDTDLLDRLLRAEGYYNAIIRPAVLQPEGGGKGKLRVVFTIRTGARYMLDGIMLPGLAAAERQAPKLKDAFPVKAGDPVDAYKIKAARTRLATALGENGFPFASVEEPQVTVDHDTQKGDLEVVVRSGGHRLFGGIELDQGSERIFSERHLERIARFDRGDVYQVSEVEDLRRAIVATGLVSSVDVKPVEAGDGEHADVAVSVSPAPMRTIAGEIGYGTGEGYRLEASWQHRNFFPPEGAITVRGLLGTKEQAAGVTYRRNNFRRRDNIVSATASYRHQEFDAYQAKTITLSAGLERQTNLLYQKTWSWSVGTEFVASRERDYFGEPLTLTNRDYLIAALPLSVTYDTSDDLLDPTRGFRLGARISPEAAWQGGAYTYVKTQLDGSIYMPVSEKLVIAARARLGSILGGVDTDRIAPSRRFYAGGGASVRGYGYQAIGPRDPENDPVGGKSLAEFSLEARIRLGVFGIVPFIDAGNISTGFLPEFGDVRYGAGIGLRYYSNFGPIRIDVGTPLNRQPGDSRIAVYVSLGQAF